METSSYSYLPKEAKNYIKAYYAETDNIILTEKNKQPNEAYLNPDFVDYLTMSSYEQEKREVIPTDLIVDSTPEAIEQIDENLPSKFDLRDIDGKNYMTPIKNQGSLGLCWSFATNAQMETYLAITNNQPVSSSSQIFSERQLDYATSNDGIFDFKFAYANRSLGRGGNFYYVMHVATSGYATKDASWDKKILKSGNYYDTTMKKKSEIYNYSSSLYEVDEAKHMPFHLSSESDYNMIKHMVKNYGGMYVMTISPNTNTGRNIYDNNYVLYGLGTDHAMQIIGWDDNYKYKYCEWNRSIEDCPASVIHENTEGSWIIKNSWGDTSAKKYLYLPYSLAVEPAVVTKMVSMADRTWDYQLDYTKLENVTVSGKEQKKIVFNAPIDSRMSKLKFFSNSTDRNVKVYYKTSNGRKLIDTVGIDLKGWYTVDLYDKNLERSDKCVFHIEDPDYLTPINISTPKLFLNSDGVASVTTSPVDYSTEVIVPSYDFTIESQVYGIPEGETLDYKIYDLNGKDISQYINSYSDNAVSGDFVIASMSVSNKLIPGEYIIEVYHNGEYLDETSLIIEAPYISLEGEGTIDNPYLIKSPSDLDLIRTSTSSSYKLSNDIDLTYDTQNENGIFYNSGTGWQSITNFKGTFDGDNHKITGLYSTRNGLFDSVTVSKVNDNNSIFSNLTLQNFNIVNSSNNNVAALVGTLEADSNVSNIIIDNVSITSSNISSEGKAAGLVANSNSFVPISFTNCYNNSEIYSKISGGIYGSLKIASVINSANEGIVNGNNIAGGIGGETTLATLDKVINTAKVDSQDIVGGLIGKTNSANITSFINYGDVTAEIFAAGGVGQLNNMTFDSSGNVNITGNLFVNSGYNTGNIGCLSCEGKEELVSSTGEKYTSHCSDELVCRDSSIAPLTDENINIENINYFKGTIAQNVLVKENVKKIDYIDAYDIENNFNWPNFENNWIIDNSFPTINNKKVVNKVSNIIPNISELTINLSHSDNYVIESTVEGNIFNKGVVYYSDNNDILEVDKNGNITAKAVGSANIIIVSISNGTKKILPVSVKVSKYNINYHSNTDEDNIITQSVTFNASDKLLENTFKNGYYKFSGWNTKPDGTGKTYSEQQEIINLINEDETIDLYAVWSIDGLIKTEVYGYDIENNLIYNIGVQTTVKEFIKNTSFNSNYHYSLYNSKNNLIEDTDIITTGSYIQMIDNNGENYKIYLSVRGDINNDGLISITDISRLFRYIVDDNYSIDLPNIKSSDVNDDNRVTITDLSKLFAYIMKNISKL